RQRRHFRRAAPEAADPDRIIRVALLELDPHAGADLRHHVHAALLAGDRHARHRPAGRDQSGHVRHLHLDAPALFRVHVLDHRAAVIDEEHVHAGTSGTVETRPLRDSWKLCRYSPRRIVWRTWVT